ncbi:MAG: type III pantothenate kinase, partial [Oscillospiraceae bacterium]
MLLTIDIGNTNIVIGAFEKDCLKFVSRIQTNKYRMADEYAIIIKGILEFNGYTTDMFDGAIASCVVPPLIPTMKKTIDRLFNTKLMIISPGIKTGLNIKIDNPATLGSDLACGAVGAIKKYSLPCIVIDLGTATKFYVISDDNSFLGGAIMPGVSISLDALSKNTAQLPHIELQNTKNVVGTNSIDCMCSGVVYGTASMIDG